MLQIISFVLINIVGHNDQVMNADAMPLKSIKEFCCTPYSNAHSSGIDYSIFITITYPPAVANRLQGAVRKLINNKRITYISTSLIEYLPVLVTDRRISFSLQVA